MLVDRLKDARSQLMFFEQAAKLQQARCVRGAFASEIHTDKAANRLAFVQRIFNRLIGKPKALLCAVRCTCAASSQDRSAGGRGLPLWDRTVQAQPQGASKALPPRSQRESDRVASGAFWRHTQDQRSLLAQEFSTRPLQSLLYISFSSLGRGRAQ